MHEAERLKAVEQLLVELLRAHPARDALYEAAREPIRFTAADPDSEGAIEARRFHETVHALKLGYLRDACRAGREISMAEEIALEPGDDEDDGTED